MYILNTARFSGEDSYGWVFVLKDLDICRPAHKSRLAIRRASSKGQYENRDVKYPRGLHSEIFTKRVVPSLSAKTSWVLPLNVFLDICHIKKRPSPWCSPASTTVMGYRRGELVLLIAGRKKLHLLRRPDQR